MGSITATPANGILITFIGLNNVGGADNLSFATWLLWGIPLVIGYVGLSWIVLVSFFYPGVKTEVSIMILQLHLRQVTIFIFG